MTRICLHCNEKEPGCTCDVAVYAPPWKLAALKAAQDRLKHPVLTPWIQDASAQELADQLYGPKEA